MVDCGRVVNPRNAAAQIEGGMIIALSVAIGEDITLEQGAVVQSNFADPGSSEGLALICYLVFQQCR